MPEVPAPESLYDYSSSPTTTAAPRKDQRLSPEVVYPIAGPLKGAETLALHREKEMEDKLARAERMAVRANYMCEEDLKTADYVGRVQDRLGLEVSPAVHDTTPPLPKDFTKSEEKQDQVQASDSRSPSSSSHGYSIHEYRSMYDKSDYQINEYKPMYDS